MSEQTDGPYKAEEPSQGEIFAFSLTPKALFSILAIASYWGFIFAAYWGTSFVPDASANSVAQSLCKSAGFIGQAAAFGVLFLMWRRLSSNSGRTTLLVLAACLCPFGALPVVLSHFGIMLPLPASMLCVFLFGCGHACLLSLTGYILDALTGPIMGLLLSLAILVSCGIYVCIINLPTSFQSYALLFLPWLCCVFTEVARSGRNLTDQDFHSGRLKECSNPRAPMEFRQFFIQVLFYSIVFSLTQLLAGYYGINAATSDVFWIAILLSGTCMLVYSVFVNRYVSPQVSLWYMLPLVALGLLPLPFAGPEDQFACWFLIAFGFTFFDMMSLYHLSSFIKFNNLSILRYFCLGRFANALGMAVGWVLGFGAFSLMQPGARTVGYFSSGLVILLIFIIVFMNRPDTRGRVPEAGLPATPPAGEKQGGAGVAPFEESAAEAAPMRRPWHECCAELSAQYGLSPRESEVFALLSRGRTTRYISEQLFISQATAKTHIYRIYRKLDINSQQELIDLFESHCRPHGETPAPE